MILWFSLETCDSYKTGFEPHRSAAIIDRYKASNSLTFSSLSGFSVSAIRSGFPSKACCNCSIMIALSSENSSFSLMFEVLFDYFDFIMARVDELNGAGCERKSKAGPNMNKPATAKVLEHLSSCHQSMAFVEFKDASWAKKLGWSIWI